MISRLAPGHNRLGASPARARLAKSPLGKPDGAD